MRQEALGEGKTEEEGEIAAERIIYALFEFDQPIFSPVGSMLIASRLDFDVSTTISLCMADHCCSLSWLPALPVFAHA
jgi:hypothetical protein